MPLPRESAGPDASHHSHAPLRALPGGARGAAGLAELSDGRLLTLAQEGDREAFGVLVTRHHRVLAGLIRQRLGPGAPVEDLLQDVFTKALLHIGGFAGRSSFTTWAGSIALNLATDWGRKRVRRKRLTPPADVDQGAIADHASERPFRAVEEREEAGLARRAMDQLPERMRLAVTLRVVDELEYDEVAARLGAPVATARTWVSRGLKQLRRILEVPDGR